MKVKVPRSTRGTVRVIKIGDPYYGQEGKLLAHRFTGDQCEALVYLPETKTRGEMRMYNWPQDVEKVE